VLDVTYVVGWGLLRASTQPTLQLAMTYSLQYDGTKASIVSNGLFVDEVLSDIEAVLQKISKHLKHA